VKLVDPSALPPPGTIGRSKVKRRARSKRAEPAGAASPDHAAVGVSASPVEDGGGGTGAGGEGSGVGGGVGDGGGGGGGGASPPSKGGRKGSVASGAALLSVAQLQQIISSRLGAARELDGKSFGTLKSRIGQLLNQKSGTSVEELMGAWDRNRDGTISKQEFRLNVRKLGVSEKEALSKDIDTLYDEFDDDKSGAVDLSEMKTALKRLQAALATEKSQVTKTQKQVELYRWIAEEVEKAVADTEACEAEETTLAELKRGTTSTRLGELLKGRNVKVGQMVTDWDKDGTGSLSREEFCQNLKSMGLGSTTEEVGSLFDELDDDRSGSLGKEELVSAMKRILANTVTMRAQAAKQGKTCTKARSVAQKVQAVAMKSLAEAEAQLLALE
jgi:Ca2+-binding EF-hand superfamily protein